jgi:hypothetical protein
VYDTNDEILAAIMHLHCPDGFECGVRDKRTGEVAWHDLVSVRHAEIAFRNLLQAEGIV